MLKRDELAQAIVAEIKSDPDWLTSRINPAYTHHLWELSNLICDPGAWRFNFRDGGQGRWTHRLRLRLPEAYAGALRRGTEALVFEYDGHITRIDFWG